MSRRPASPFSPAIVLSALGIAGCSSRESVSHVVDRVEATANDGPWWVVLLAMSFAVIVVLVAELVRAGRGRRSFRRPDWWIFLGVAVVAVALLIPVWVYPTRTSVVVDGVSATITVERDFLLRSSSVETYAFGAVQRLHYHYRPPHGEDRAAGLVRVVFDSGESVEIFKGSPKGATDFAAAAARVLRVPITES